MGPLLDEKFASRYEEFLGWVQPHHRVQAESGRITGRQPTQGVRRRCQKPACSTTRWSSMASGRGDAIFDEETFGPLVGIATYTDFAEALELANAPWLRAFLVDLHD